LSELFDEIAREPLQVEVSAVRILFKLLGFLLKKLLAISYQLSVTPSKLFAHDSFYSSEAGWLPDSSASFRLQ
jgi:hypothetical protein